MAERPTGTITFLFTDIEGSTRQWDESPEAMGAAVAQHDAILRHAVGEHGGYIFSTAGDGVGAAFQRATDATAAALAAQQAIAAQQWPAGVELKMRAGLHTGEAEERDRDYFGPSVNRTARVMGAAHGTQTVVSSTTAQLIGGLTAVGLVDLGSHRLKGLTDPVHLFGLSTEHIVWLDRPLVTDQPVPGNLPRVATEYVGRVDLLASRAAELSDRRLVTLTGPGGVGKTRTAIEAGWLTVDQFPGGVWLVELASVVDPDAVPAAVAATLSVPPQPGMTLISSIVDWLRNRRLLLILDNCEHVLAPANELVRAVLAACPTVTVLTTSREPLGASGERVVPVASLELADAVQLLRDRATAADASLVLGPEDHTVMNSICARLDGIPLAIELAAARVRSLSLADLDARLDDRFRVLRGGGRGGLERHQTLRATVAWSYQLLTAPERQVFDRASVFAGGFDLAAAEAVCAADDADRDDVLDVLGSLVDKSMVIAERHGSTMRYRLLETLRQYGEERLDDAGATAECRHRHTDHYLSVAQRARALQLGPQQMMGQSTIATEWDNLRAAVEWCWTIRDTDRAQALLHATFLYSWMVMPLEHAGWCQRLLDADDVVPTSGTYMCAATWALFATDTERQRRIATAGIAAAGEPGDVATCAFVLATALLSSGDLDSAERVLSEGEAPAAASAELYGLLWITGGWLNLSWVAGDRARASRAYERHMEIAKAIGAPWTLVDVEMGAMSTAAMSGDHDATIRQARRAISLATEIGMASYLGLAQSALTQALFDRGGDSVDVEVGDILRQLHDARHQVGRGSVLEAIALRAAQRADKEAAARLLGYLESASGVYWMRVQRRATLEDLVNAWPESGSWRIAGAAMTDDEAVAYALALLTSG